MPSHTRYRGNSDSINCLHRYPLGQTTWEPTLFIDAAECRYRYVELHHCFFSSGQIRSLKMSLRTRREMNLRPKRRLRRRKRRSEVMDNILLTGRLGSAKSNLLWMSPSHHQETGCPLGDRPTNTEAWLVFLLLEAVAKLVPRVLAS